MNYPYQKVSPLLGDVFALGSRAQLSVLEPLVSNYGQLSLSFVYKKAKFKWSLKAG